MGLPAWIRVADCWQERRRRRRYRRQQHWMAKAQRDRILFLWSSSRCSCPTARQVSSLTFQRFQAFRIGRTDHGLAEKHLGPPTVDQRVVPVLVKVGQEVPLGVLENHAEQFLHLLAGPARFLEPFKGSTSEEPRACFILTKIR